MGVSFRLKAHVRCRYFARRAVAGVTWPGTAPMAGLGTVRQGTPLCAVNIVPLNEGFPHRFPDIDRSIPEGPRVPEGPDCTIVVAALNPPRLPGLNIPVLAQ